MTHRHLPPLKSLVYFESAARLLSFTRASDELSVTQGAVSRQVRQLEQFLGRALFRREQRQVFLTTDGESYYKSISQLLDQLAMVTDTLCVPRESNQVVVATSSALASMYLLPRIPRFRAMHDDIQIRLIARDTLLELEQTDYDLALYFSSGPPQDRIGELLFEERVFPVCSPQYLAEHRHQFEAPAGLSQNLIWHETTEDWINWPQWLEAMGIEMSSFGNRLVLSSYPMVIQAVLAGQGVALGWERFVDQYLSSGELVQPMAHTLSTGNGFYLMQPTGRKPSTAANRVVAWLQEHQYS